MGGGQSTTIHACWRTIRNRKEIFPNGVDGGPVRLHLVNSNGMGRTNLLPRNMHYRQSTSQTSSKSRAYSRARQAGKARRTTIQGPKFEVLDFRNFET